MSILAENRKARFDYEIIATYEAGVVLSGFEVKAVKSGRIELVGAFAIVRGQSLWLLNANIPPYQPNNAPKDYDSRRSRQLLLNRKEIQELIGKIKERGLTLVPLRVYTKNNLVKIELGLARGRRGPDKRQAIKQREAKREIARSLKN